MPSDPAPQFGLLAEATGQRLVLQVMKSAAGQKRWARELRDWKLFSFLTTEANDIVRPVHEKAMPVILIDPAEQVEWLRGGEDSLRLQRPLPNEQLKIIADQLSDTA